MLLIEYTFSWWFHSYAYTQRFYQVSFQMAPPQIPWYALQSSGIAHIHYMWDSLVDGEI